MIKFDSVEYWQSHLWDRYSELEKVPALVREEFLRQENLTVAKALSLLNDRNELKIMDLACGTGRISKSILKAMPASKRAELILIDFNDNALEKAKTNLKEYRNVGFSKLDAYNIGDEFKEYFDIVIAMDFLHHIANLHDLLSRIEKTLLPGGTFIGNVFADRNYKKWDKCKYGVYKSKKRLILHALTSSSLYRLSPTFLKKLIRYTGTARIAPLSLNELNLYLKSYFVSVETVTSYYYWFSARKQSS